MIYHVAVHSAWHDAIVSGEYRVSTLGLSLDEVGFIHASERRQVTPTAERFYRGQRDLVVLVIDERRVAADGVEIRREDAGNGELFPHIYGAIRPHWVVAVEDL
ncbi:MAG: DUF952 domain-containing protein [Actinomycetota bacterium]